MTEYRKVVDRKGLVREMHSKAVLNTDHEALLEHRKKKAVLKEVMTNSQKINQMENDIQEIKRMLFSIVEKTKV